MAAFDKVSLPTKFYGSLLLHTVFGIFYKDDLYKFYLVIWTNLNSLKENILTITVGRFSFIHCSTCHKQQLLVQRNSQKKQQLSSQTISKKTSNCWFKAFFKIPAIAGWKYFSKYQQLLVESISQNTSNCWFKVFLKIPAIAGSKYFSKYQQLLVQITSQYTSICWFKVLLKSPAIVNSK